MENSCDLAGEAVYNWESSVPDGVKNPRMAPKARMHHVKVPSVDYLKFSEKVLKEYSKASTSFNNYKKKVDNRSKARPMEFLNESKPLLPRVEFQLPRIRESKIIHHSLKPVGPIAFSFALPEKHSSSYIIHQYSLPNGLILNKNLTKPERQHTDVNTGHHSVLQPSRAGLLGKKLEKINKNGGTYLITRYNKD